MHLPHWIKKTTPTFNFDQSPNHKSLLPYPAGMPGPPRPPRFASVVALTCTAVFRSGPRMRDLSIDHIQIFESNTLSTSVPQRWLIIFRLMNRRKVKVLRKVCGEGKIPTGVSWPAWRVWPQSIKMGWVKVVQGLDFMVQYHHPEVHTYPHQDHSRWKPHSSGLTCRPPKTYVLDQSQYRTFNRVLTYLLWTSSFPYLLDMKKV